MSDLIWQGVTISVMGMGLTFVTLGFLILTTILLKRLTRNDAHLPVPNETVLDKKPPVSATAQDTEEEIAAAIAVALVHLRSAGVYYGDLGTTLEAGRGPWWMAGRTQQRSAHIFENTPMEKLVMDSISKRKLKVTVNGKPFLVEVDDLSASPMTIKVNGHPYVVDIDTAEVKTTSPVEPATTLDTAVLPTPAPAKPADRSEATVTAPMPGQIIDIAVKPGDEISPGQTLCSLEAMKMKNSIRSPRQGVIASVEVTVGQSVNYGDVLVAFE